MPPRAVAALLLSQLIAMAAFAQSDASKPASTSEFGRVSGGQIEVLTKHSQRLSGSLGISASRSQSPFLSHGRRYDATLGGTLLSDRLWFFATAEQNDPFTAASGFESPTPLSRGMESKVTGQLGDRQTLAASFATSRSAVSPLSASTPASFLSLRYTGIVSDNMFFDVNISRSNAVSGGGVRP